MARVDDTSDAVRMWANDVQETHRRRGELLFREANPSRFTHPVAIPMLPREKVDEVVAKLMRQRDSWIHMDRRAGPLPAFIFGTYYQYLSFGRHFPTPEDVEQARAEHAGDGVLPPGRLATSTLNYTQVVQQYRTIFLEEFGDLYDLILETLANATGRPCVYDDNWVGALLSGGSRVVVVMKGRVTAIDIMDVDTILFFYSKFPPTSYAHNVPGRRACQGSR